MGLIVTAGSPDHVVLVADRRVRAEGLPYDAGANDPLILRSRDARLGVTYLGLGAAEGFDARSWLLLALHAALQPVGRLSFEQLCLIADQRWVHLGEADRRLTVVMAGHVQEEGQSYPAFGIVSNWELPPDMDYDRPIDDRFRSIWWKHTTARNFEESFAVPAGEVELVAEEEMEGLRALAASGATGDALAQRAVAIVRGAQTRAEGDALSGECVSVTIPADPSADPVVSLHLAGGSRIAPSRPPVITPDSLVTSDVVAATTAQGGLEREKVGRNSGCPCGSGRKYKFCHGSA